ncbi:putative 26S proteasome complex subunit sem-1 [Venturia nashicola]|uniref:26S proteasome complex subunit SEM1 n=1 Tax=Venturia nashicola TaxID=86259 RepID=A0A4Z1PEK1_9PEZI|nr:putative 26S proteasome complex subunit sem-1 [Venturia nashicola]TLD34437.1 putative 26S proteasome complex subunit sem-1 [Venturia nashicola]
MSSAAKAPATDNTPTKEQKPTAALEEDDEFEDFPAEDWPEEDTELPSGNQHLWEESWDDDDTNEDFSKQLKDELKKVEANKGR